ncbi:meiotically up-regulated 87 protein [Tothia fuscella]|uniref:Meiotically up-regulated 87 protein n=1 Tax=Tothia fuscella TaxID=1048955 RepID=A0A9P4NKU5_9PEZI|nr:meiotically up-regulated 87 protein [Tothia fuscella]
MSLFGSLGSQPPASSGSGLFSGLGAGTASAAQTTPSLLNPAPPKKSIFGGLNLSTSTSQPQQSTTSGLFGGLGTSQPQATGGLFGASQPQQQQSSSGDGLFSGLGATSTQPQQNTSNLFGSLNATAQNANNAAGNSLFGSTTGPAQQQNQTQAEPAKASAAYFDQMLERGRKRNAQSNGVLSDLPTLQLGLGDIARKVRNLGTGGPSAEQAKAGAGARAGAEARNGAGDSRAHYLLAASGVSTAAALRDLNNFSAQAGAGAVPSTTSIPDTDIEGYVSHLQTQSTLDMIQEGLEQSKRDFDNFLEENVQMNWDAQRQRIYEHFGLVKPSDDSDDANGGSFGASARERGAFGKSSRRQRPNGLGVSTSNMSFGQYGMNKSVLGTSAMRNSTRGATFTDMPNNGAHVSMGGAEDRLLRGKQELYAEKVKELTESRIKESCYPVLAQFADVEAKTGVDGTATLLNSYNCLINIVNEPDKVLQPTDAGALRERQFVRQYMDETPSSAQSMVMRKQIINGARTCLEQMFLKRVNTVIEKDPRVAQIGGVPSHVSTIRGFIRVMDNRKELGDSSLLQRLNVDGTEDACWAVIFFLLRSGLVAEAAEYVSQNGKAIRSIDRFFTRWMEQYANSPDHRLSPEIRNTIAKEYSGKMKTAAEDSLDPYRMACYKIIGRVELTRRVFDTIKHDEEDWMWLQFVLAREVPRSEEMAGEVYGLEQIQASFKGIGSKHFAVGAENPGGFATYFFMLISCGLFEDSISWLYQHSHVTAVHFAIALTYYGLLRTSDLNTTEFISYNTRQQPRVNYGRLLGFYTGEFRAAQPVVAADYISLINLNSDLPGEAGIVQAKTCWEGLQELVLETREFAALIGDVRSDGTRQPGAIEQRISLIRLKDDYAAGKRKAQADLYNTKSFMDNLTIQAAVAADDSGRTTDAVLLYHLAEEYNNVIVIINRTLSEALSVEIGQEHMRLEPLKPRSQAPPSGQEPSTPDNSTLSLTSVDDPVTLAHSIQSLYASQGLIWNRIKQENREACQMLIQLSHAKSLVEHQDFGYALQAIEQLHLLPITARGSINVIRQHAQNFAKLSPMVARNIGDLMTWTIFCCGRQRERLRESGFENDTNTAQSEALLQGARDLMVFAGLIRFRLPPKVFDILARAGQDFGV